MKKLTVHKSGLLRVILTINKNITLPSDKIPIKLLKLCVNKIIRNLIGTQSYLYRPSCNIKRTQKIQHSRCVLNAETEYVTKHPFVASHPVCINQSLTKLNHTRTRCNPTLSNSLHAFNVVLSGIPLQRRLSSYNLTQSNTCLHDKSTHSSVVMSGIGQPHHRLLLCNGTLSNTCIRDKSTHSSVIMSSVSLQRRLLSTKRLRVHHHHHQKIAFEIGRTFKTPMTSNYKNQQPTNLIVLKEYSKIPASVVPYYTTLPSGRSVVVDAMTDHQVREVYQIVQDAAQSGQGFGADEYADEKEFMDDIKGGFQYAVMDKNSGEMVAAFIFTESQFSRVNKVADMFIIVKKGLSGSGLGTFCTKLCVQFAKEFGFKGIYADTFTNNTGMINIVETIPGFQKVGCLPMGGVMKDGKIVELFIYFKDLRDQNVKVI